MNRAQVGVGRFRQFHRPASDPLHITCIDFAADQRFGHGVSTALTRRRADVEKHHVTGEQVKSKGRPKAALEKARRELACVAEHAAEEGYPVPQQAQIEQADHLLRQVFSMAPADYTVYPTPNSEIAIDITTDDISIILYSHPDGAAECFVDTDDSQSHAWYRNSEEVLGAFLQDALAKLQPPSSSWTVFVEIEIAAHFGVYRPDY